MRRVIAIGMPILIVAVAILAALLRRQPEIRGGAPRTHEVAKPGEENHPVPPSSGQKPENLPSTPSPKTTVRPATLTVHITSGGTSVAGARVRIVQGEEDGATYRDGGSGEDGMVFFDKLPFGNYQVLAKTERHIPAQVKVTLKEGEQAVIPLTLVMGATLMGAVVDPADAPVSEAVVTMIDPEKKTPIHPAYNVMTDVRGSFAIHGLPLDREMSLHVSAERFRSVLREGYRFSVPGEVQQARIALSHGKSVGGRVVDSTGAPIPGASVGASNEFARLIRTDAQGRFEITGLGDEPVNMFTSAEGFGAAYLRGIVPGTSGIVFRMFRAGAISGRVTADRPVRNFVVLLYQYQVELKKELLVRPTTVEGARDGEFVIRNLSPGPYSIVVQSEGYEPSDRVDVVVPMGQAVENVPVFLRRK